VESVGSGEYGVASALLTFYKFILNIFQEFLKSYIINKSIYLKISYNLQQKKIHPFAGYLDSGEYGVASALLTFYKFILNIFQEFLKSYIINKSIYLKISYNLQQKKIHPFAGYLDSGYDNKPRDIRFLRDVTF